MGKWFKQLFEDATGNADEMATMCIIGFFTFVGLQGFDIVAHGTKFDPQAFGVGIGAFLGAAAAGMGIKAGKESQ